MKESVRDRKKKTNRYAVRGEKRDGLLKNPNPEPIFKDLVLFSKDSDLGSVKKRYTTHKMKL